MEIGIKGEIYVSCYRPESFRGKSKDRSGSKAQNILKKISKQAQFHMPKCDT